MATQPDYYRILGVDSQASEEEIRRAFRTKAMEYHPDRNKAADAGDRFKEINAAYLLLTDPVRRSQYDRSRYASGDPSATRSGSSRSGPTASEEIRRERERRERIWREYLRREAQREQAQREQAQREQAQRNRLSGNSPSGSKPNGNKPVGNRPSESNPAAILRKISRFRIGITTKSAGAEAAARPAAAVVRPAVEAVVHPVAEDGAGSSQG